MRGKVLHGGHHVTIGRSMHDRAVEYRRPVCGKKMAGKRELYDHKWAHAI